MPPRTTQHAALGEIFTRDFLVLACINLCVFFGFQMLNVGLPVYMDQLGATAQVVGLATTLMTITATLMRVFSGVILDRFGRMGVLVAGTSITLCAIVSFALFPVVGIILALRLLHGIGWGMGSTASSTIAADIIPKHRFAEGMGYFAMTVSIASALAPAASIGLVQGPGALYMIYASAGCTALSLVLAVAQAVRKYARGRHEGALHGERALHSGKSCSAPKNDGAPTSIAQSGLERFFDRRALLPGVMIFLVNVGFGCITTFIALHSIAQGVENASVYFVVYAIVTLVSRPYIGMLIDRHGYRIPAVLASLCTAATLVVIGIASHAVMFGVAGMLAGLGIGTAMGTFQSMAVASVEPWRRGVATSTYMTAFDLGIAVGSLLGGVLVAAVGYTAMYFIVALSPLLACLVALYKVRPGDGVNL